MDEKHSYKSVAFKIGAVIILTGSIAVTLAGVIYMTGSGAHPLLLLLLLGSAGAAVATAMILIAVFNRSVSQRIFGALKEARRAKNGDPAVGIDETGPRDENREPRERIDAMTAALRDKTLALETETAERKRIQREYEKAREEAENANRARREFLANMSHEIRTPLNAVTGFSELLTSMVTDEKQKNYLDGIKTAGKCLLLLINDILDLSKIEAGMMKIEHAPVNPMMIFDEIERIFKAELAAKRLELIMDLDEEMPTTLMFDRTKLRQILVNIVGNAVKFTETGFIKLSSEAICKTDDRERIDLIIYVQDTGIGIPERDRELIFKSFRQQDGQATRKYGGAGLGLSISKRLVEMMNGEIEVKSRIGRGSTFKITLRDIVASAAPNGAGNGKPSETNRFSFEKKDVLVVGGPESDRARLRELLEEVNLSVSLAGNETDALHLAREHPPDLVLVEDEAPDGGGADLAKKIKENPETENTPIIAITSSGRSRYGSKGERAVFDGRLTRPVSKHPLLSELSLHLTHSVKQEPPESAPAPLDAPGDMAVEDAEKLHDLIKILREEIAPALEYAKRVMKMSEIGKISDRLESLGEENNVRGLVNYADGLRGFARSFDIANIEKKIVEFPDLMNALEKQGANPQSVEHRKI